jgi:hypothetical protein
MATLIKVACGKHGAQLVNPIAPLGPTLTRPALRIIPRIEDWRGGLWSADPECEHYITFRLGGGVECIRCGGWYCT